MPDYNQPPQYEELVRTLLEKTLKGKLSWESTAEEGAFVSTAKGEMSFIIRREYDDHFPAAVIASTSRPENPEYLLTVKDSEGREILTTPPMTMKDAGDLYDVAYRLAEGIDEKIANTLSFLQTI